MKKFVSLCRSVLPVACVLVVALLVFQGCVATTGNPIVVRCEQSETITLATFQTALDIDNSNRELFKTKVPAFHNFCEWLRVPVTLNPTNTLPRGAAMIWSLNETKLAYKKGAATSNMVVTVLAPVEAALGQLQAYFADTNVSFALPK